MRIDEDGKVGIGTDAPAHKLHIVSDDSDNYRGLYIYDEENNPDTNNIMVDLDYGAVGDLDNATFILFQDSGGEVGQISADGALTTFNTSSDYRLKTDYKDIVDATGTINQLKLYDFAWKRNTNKRGLGVIAHEAEALVPTAIRGEKDAMTTKEYTDADGVIKTKEVIKPQQADYSQFVPLLLKSIQELSAKVTALENA